MGCIPWRQAIELGTNDSVQEFASLLRQIERPQQEPITPQDKLNLTAAQRHLGLLRRDTNDAPFRHPDALNDDAGALAARYQLQFEAVRFVFREPDMPQPADRIDAVAERHSDAIDPTPKNIRETLQAHGGLRGVTRPVPDKLRCASASISHDSTR